MAINNNNKNKNIPPPPPSSQQQKIDYDAMLQDETVKALMNHLQIKANITTILDNEQILYLLQATKSNKVVIEGQEYKKRPRSYDMKEYIMTKNQEYHKLKESDENDLSNIAKERFNLHSDILKFTYGIMDTNLINKYYGELEVIAEGELYKILRDYWNDWNMEPIIDNITNIIQYTNVKLQQNVNERNKIEKQIVSPPPPSPPKQNIQEERKTKGNDKPVYTVDEFVEMKNKERQLNKPKPAPYTTTYEDVNDDNENTQGTISYNNGQIRIS